MGTKYAPRTLSIAGYICTALGRKRTKARINDSPADFGKFIAEEAETCAKVVRFSGASAS